MVKWDKKEKEFKVLPPSQSWDNEDISWDTVVKSKRIHAYVTFYHCVWVGSRWLFGWRKVGGVSLGPPPVLCWLSWDLHWQKPWGTGTAERRMEVDAPMWISCAVHQTREKGLCVRQYLQAGGADTVHWKILLWKRKSPTTLSYQTKRGRDMHICIT